MHYQQTTEVPLSPVIIYAREETAIEPGDVGRIPTYWQDKSYFDEHAYFGMHNDKGRRYRRDTTCKYAEHQIKYQVASAMECEALTKHADECEALGAFNVEGRTLAMDKTPTLAARKKSSHHTTVASDTPVGVVTASCRGNTLDCNKNRGYKNPKHMEFNSSLSVRSFTSSRGGE